MTPSLPVPLSAYALCFFPLAAVVFGLIAFFVLTDRHATRPYLRYNPFVAATVPPEEAAARGPAVGETPAGPLGAPAGTTAVYTGGNVGDVEIVPEGTQPEAKVPITYQPPFEGTNVGIGHTEADDAPPRPGQVDYGTPDDDKIAQVQPGPIDQPTAASGGEAVSSAFAGLAPDKPAPNSSTAQTRLTSVEVPSVRDSRASVTGGAGTSSGAATETGVTIVHVESNPAGDTVGGEYIQIANVSNIPVDLTGWVLRDQNSRHTFTFAGFVLAPQSDVKVWSGNGTSDANNLYWNNRTAIWNNTGDVAVLEDLTGTVVSSFSFSGEAR